jgi:hypothetical protein
LAPRDRGFESVFLQRRVACEPASKTGFYLGRDNCLLGVFGMPLAFSLNLSFIGYAQSQGLFSGGYVGLENM